MQSLDTLQTRMQSFAEKVNANKALVVHKNNKFNKQFGVLTRDINYLVAITSRIEKGNTDKPIELALDLKSFYVFGRVYSESLIYIASFLIDGSEKIKWDKIGPFLESTERNLQGESDSFKMFWSRCATAIRLLATTFKYRNEILHGKDSNTEWTFAWPGHSNLDHVFLANVPWREDKESSEEKKSLNARNLGDMLASQGAIVLDYLESSLI